MNNAIIMALIGLIALISISCGDDDPTGTNTAEEIFEFTASPIDLQGIDAKYVADVSYDVYDETKFDVWLPTSASATGLVIYIHGGGFTGGDKSVIASAGSWDLPAETRALLSNGIAVASINYRLLNGVNETEGVLKSLNDSRRALQYIRSRADDFNLRGDDIVLAGSSAGGGTALWIAMNDDMGDASNSDHVLRQSTRVKGVALRQTQSSYDLEDRWINDVFVDYGLTWEDFFTANRESVGQLYGVPSVQEYNTTRIDDYRDRVDMLDLITSDDPEIWAENVLTPVTAPTTSGVANHHAYHVREIKERADQVGVANVCYYGRDPLLYGDPSNETYVEFLVRKIGE